MHVRDELRDEPQRARGVAAKRPPEADLISALGNVATQQAVQSGVMAAPGVLARAARGIQREAAEEEEVEEAPAEAEAPAPADPVAAAAQAEEELPE